MIADKIDGVLETVSAIELRNVRAADITNWGQKATAELESIGTDITNWGQKASAEILESISTEFTDWGSKMFKTITYPFSGNQESSVEKIMKAPLVTDKPEEIWTMLIPNSGLSKMIGNNSTDSFDTQLLPNKS